jgi:hypothetical protein
MRPSPTTEAAFVYRWDDIDELREDVAGDLARGLLPPTLALGYDGPRVAVVLQGPLFCAEDADAIVDRVVDVFGRLTVLRRVLVVWPARFEDDGSDSDEWRSSDGGLWAMMVTRGALEDDERAHWRCSLLPFRFDRDAGEVEVSAEEGGVDIDTIANPYPRRLRAVLDPSRHERALVDPYVDTRVLEADGYLLGARPGLELLVPVADDGITTVDGRIWPTAELS